MSTTYSRILFTLLCIAVFSYSTLAQTAETKAAKPPRNLAILIFDGVQIIDYTGRTYEKFYSERLAVHRRKGCALERTGFGRASRESAASLQLES